jgi:threonine dehydrogenase-like Zn-dependent dehydrogenase
LMSIKSCFLLGAERVIAIDRFTARLEMARAKAGAEVLNYEEVDVREALREMTGGRGPDHCIDAVGSEGHLPGAAGLYDVVKTKMMLETDRAPSLRQAILACRPGGTVSIPGVYGGVIDKFPIGAVVNKALTIKTGQTHVQRYLRPLLDRVQKGDIDPSFVITHRLKLADAPAGYRMFRDKQDDCVKVILRP